MGYSSTTARGVARRSVCAAAVFGRQLNLAGESLCGRLFDSELEKGGGSRYDGFGLE